MTIRDQSTANRLYVTMAFSVKTPAMLDMLKRGNKVKFKAKNVGGSIVVTELQVSK